MLPLPPGFERNNKAGNLVALPAPGKEIEIT
jgi:hypothetical protein